MTWHLAPEWQTTDWLNTKEPLSLAKLRGRVVMLHAFQMLCPGCVARGIPQAQRVQAAFAGAPLSVVGMHTVFEHHDAMQLPSLKAFLHEYRVTFPVGVDAPGEGDHIPRTMRAYAMQGTPTTVLIDAQGYVRRQVFGVHDDLVLGAEIQTLLLEAEAHARNAPPKPEHSVRRATPAFEEAAPAGEGCDASGCRIDDAP